MIGRISDIDNRLVFRYCDFLSYTVNVVYCILVTRCDTYAYAVFTAGRARTEIVLYSSDSACVRETEVEKRFRCIERNG